MQHVARMLTVTHQPHSLSLCRSTFRSSTRGIQPGRRAVDWSSNISGHSSSTFNSSSSNISSTSSTAAATVHINGMQQLASCSASQTAATDGLGQPLLSVAPMMDWTDVHFRQLARLISRCTWLWTEMVVDRTILHTHTQDKFLWFPPEQHPIVLQLGGSDPALLQAAAQAAAAYGYDELNLNCGCPSDRVAGAGCFGATLMLQPELVADCMAAIAAGAAAGNTAGPAGTAASTSSSSRSSTPRVSVKCRLGVDDADSYAQLAAFVRTVSERGGVQHFVIHARKCLLNGLSPAQNRSVPPLRHDWVWALKRDFPHLAFQLNGGISTTYAAAGALALGANGTFGVGPGAVTGVMIGRAAYNDPWGVLGDADVAVFGAEQNAAANRRQVVEQYCKYADSMLGRWRTREDGSVDPNIRTLIKPLLNLFHGEPGSKRWKNAVDIALRMSPPASVSELMAATISHISDDILDAPPRPAAAAAAFASNGVLPPPYTLAVERLAVPEDHARGDKEPRGKKKKKGKVAGQVQQSEVRSRDDEDRDADAGSEQQQQQCVSDLQRGLQELSVLEPADQLHHSQQQQQQAEALSQIQHQGHTSELLDQAGLPAAATAGAGNDSPEGSSATLAQPVHLPSSTLQQHSVEQGRQHHPGKMDADCSEQVAQPVSAVVA